ncbi:MAG: sulfide/dihydroorotate dehydrogenase-like FAD/NAD-binding protein [Gammaproteobacteria bacterium]|nr:MAG: sulfide/dihydroorotate dehydrogenase-like FAD/NAD-binding protein [Gammaproteobacteria bacterium]
MARILEKRSLTPVTRLFRVEAPLVAAAAMPGQFVIVRVREGGERIPLTIADYDRDGGTITIVVQEVGVTTRYLGALEVGDDILDLLGPLGMPLEIPAEGHIVGIGGGFGAAALLCLMRELSARGNRATIIIGARQQDLLILVDELGAVCRDLLLCTDDGSVGFKGFVTERLGQLIDGDGPGRPDSVVAIGPMPMMRAVAETTRAACIPTLVSLDPLMIDGTGMCGGCRVTIDGEVKFACVDGPFFDAHQVDFEEAVRRNKMYVDQERQTACRGATSEVA